MRNDCRLRRALHIISIALITAGVVVFVDVALTLAWKEPVSTVYGSIQQGKAQDSLIEIEDSFARLPETHRASATRDPRVRIRKLARVFASHLQTGQGFGRIEIPSIGLNTVAVQGTDTASLQKGPGHYPDTAVPGQERTIGIAGHRTTYLAPFRKINEIEDGDEVTLRMAYGTFTYEVQKHEIVDPSAVQIVDDVGYERLVLTACHPLYSAAQRWAVFARLVDVEPAGSDSGDPG